MPIFLADVDNQRHAAPRVAYESVVSAAKAGSVPVPTYDVESRFRPGFVQLANKSVFGRQENDALQSGITSGGLSPAKASRKEEGESAMFDALSMVIGVFIANAAAAYGGSLCDEHTAARHLAE